MEYFDDTKYRNWIMRKRMSTIDLIETLYAEGVEIRRKVNDDIWCRHDDNLKPVDIDNHVVIFRVATYPPREQDLLELEMDEDNIEEWIQEKLVIINTNNNKMPQTLLDLIHTYKVDIAGEIIWPSSPWLEESREKERANPKAWAEVFGEKNSEK